MLKPISALAFVLSGVVASMSASVAPRSRAAAAAAPRAELPSVDRIARLARPPVNKYAEVCQVCHQATGLGLEGAFPPLAGSEWLNGPAIVPIAIVLKGLQGEIAVKGKTYNGAMTPWESMLNDADLAATLTYARSQWGNRGTPVTVAQVRAARARFVARTTPWTAAELKALK
jgi:mono/diheme cytochrome c family protein